MKAEKTKPECIWAGTWKEKNCNAPACPKHGDPEAQRRRVLAASSGMILDTKTGEIRR